MEGDIHQASGPRATRGESVEELVMAYSRLIPPTIAVVAFAAALLGPEHVAKADMNSVGKTDGGDIQLFVNCLL